MYLSLLIARRHLLKQKGTFSSFIIRLAAIATALSVAVMILALAFITGFKYEIREKLFSFWGHVHITEYNPNAESMATGMPVQRDEGLEERVLKLPHVVQLAPYAVRPGILQSGGTMEGIKLKGINKDYKLSKRVDLNGSPISFSDTAYSREILLSTATADRLQLHKGDALQLYFLEPGQLTPRIRKVIIAGVFHTGMDEIDKEYALCDIRLLQHINNWAPDQINGYQIDLDNSAYADTVSSFIYNNYVSAPLTTTTMRDIFSNIYDWLELQNVNAQIVICIMSIVAVINLAVALLILMVDRSRMVGILTALGMSRGQLRGVFRLHALLIAALGVLIGNIVGLGICWLQQRTGFLRLSEATYYMRQVPVRVEWWHIAAIDGSTLLLTLFWMWLPLLYLRRIQPAKVLQFK
jgi:lipoprotein-releasing system permease protein